MLPPSKRLEPAEIFANGTVFDIVVADLLEATDVRFDILDADDYWVWAPRLGPTATLFYTGILRYWEHRPVEEVMRLDLLQLAHDSGVADEPARRSWVRMHHFRVVNFGLDDVVTVPRYMPEHHHAQLERMNETWIEWYHQIRDARVAQQRLERT